MGNKHLKWTEKCVCGEGGGGNKKHTFVVLNHVFCCTFSASMLKFQSFLVFFFGKVERGQARAPLFPLASSR